MTDRTLGVRRLPRRRGKPGAFLHTLGTRLAKSPAVKARPRFACGDDIGPIFLDLTALVAAVPVLKKKLPGMGVDVNNAKRAALLLPRHPPTPVKMSPLREVCVAVAARQEAQVVGMPIRIDAFVEVQH